MTMRRVYDEDIGRGVRLSIKFADVMGIHEAAYHGFTDKVSRLLTDENVNEPKEDNEIKPKYAYVQGSLIKIKNDQDDQKHREHIVKGLTPLHLSASWGHAETVRIILRNPHCNPNLRDDVRADVDRKTQIRNNATPLHWAICYHHTEVVTILSAYPRLDKQVLTDDEDRLCYCSYAMVTGDIKAAIALLNNGCYTSDMTQVMKEFPKLLDDVSEDKVQFALTLQEKIWELIADNLSAIKHSGNDIKYKNFRKKYKLDEDVLRIKQFYDSIKRIDFNLLIKIPDLLVHEFDAAVKYRPLKMIEEKKNKEALIDHYVDNDDAKTDLYFKNMCPEITKNGFHVSYELLEHKQPKLGTTKAGNNAKGTKLGADKDNKSNAKGTQNLLELIAGCKETLLLDHPVVRLYMRKKWKVALAIFVPFLLFIMLYTGLFTAFMIIDPISTQMVNESSVESNATLPLLMEGCPPSQGFTAMTFIVYVLLALAGLQLILEFVQAIFRCLEYQDSDLLSISYLWVLDEILDCLCHSGVIVVMSIRVYAGCVFFGGWVWSLGVLTLLPWWLRMISHFRIIPYLGTYVVMVERVLISFMKFCSVLFLYLIAFAVIFSVIVPGVTKLSNPAFSFISTWVMMVGEMDYGDLIDPEAAHMAALTTNQWVLYIIYIVFLIVLSLIVMNLLTGIAVADVQQIHMESISKILQMQIRYSLTAERIVSPLRSCSNSCKISDTPAQFSYITYRKSLIKDFFDGLLFGPLNKGHCWEELKKIKETKKERWYFPPNLEWRKALMRDTLQEKTDDIMELVKRENRLIKQDLLEMKQELMQVIKGQGRKGRRGHIPEDSHI